MGGVALGTVAVSLFLASTESAPPLRTPFGYQIAASFELTWAADGTTGRLQVIEDERLTPSLRIQWSGADQAMHCDSPEAPDLVSLCASIAKRPLAPATVRLLGASGVVRDERRFDRELADVSPLSLDASARRTFAVTVDYSIGMGSYAGPGTFLLEVKGERLGWLRAIDSTSKKSFEIRLMKSLKNDWRVVQSRDHGGRDLLAVSCHPFEMPDAEAELRFEIIFGRYTFSDGWWVYSERREPGCWESEDEGSFPSKERFP